jgi:hypothetical protein
MHSIGRYNNDQQSLRENLHDEFMPSPRTIQMYAKTEYPSGNLLAWMTLGTDTTNFALEQPPKLEARCRRLASWTTTRVF